jgi:hypothetical protein
METHFSFECCHDHAEQVELEGAMWGLQEDDYLLDSGTDDEKEDSLPDWSPWRTVAPTIKISKRILDGGVAGFQVQIVLKVWGEDKQRSNRRHRTEEHRRQYNRCPSLGPEYAPWSCSFCGYTEEDAYWSGRHERSCEGELIEEQKKTMGSRRSRKKRGGGDRAIRETRAEAVKIYKPGQPVIVAASPLEDHAQHHTHTSSSDEGGYPGWTPSTRTKTRTARTKHNPRPPLPTPTPSQHATTTTTHQTTTHTHTTALTVPPRRSAAFLRSAAILNEVLADIHM